MGNKIYFKWIPSINFSERYMETRSDNVLDVVNIWTARSLDEMVEAVKGIEAFNGVRVTLGGLYNIVLSSVSTPIQLLSRLSIEGYSNQYEVCNEGPSLKWFLGHKEEISNPDPNKVFYMDDMAIHFSLDPHMAYVVIIAILNIKHIDTYVRMSEDDYIEGLNEPFDTFLESYGYTNRGKDKSIAKAVRTFQVAKKLGFLNAEEVVVHFNDKHLVADLKLKGVFEDIEACS